MVRGLKNLDKSGDVLRILMESYYFVEISYSILLLIQMSD